VIKSNLATKKVFLARVNPVTMTRMDAAIAIAFLSIRLSVRVPVCTSYAWTTAKVMNIDLYGSQCAMRMRYSDHSSLLKSKFMVVGSELYSENEAVKTWYPPFDKLYAAVTRKRC